MSQNMMMTFLIFLSLGAFTGLMSGILGIGGGIIVVPGLVFILGYNRLVPDQFLMQIASGTSLAVIIFTSQASFRAHYKIGEILWSAFYKLWPGMAVGVILGAVIARFMPTHSLQIFFAVFLLVVGLKMMFVKDETVPRSFPKDLVHYVSSAAIGLFSGLLGVGGGVLIVPYLSYCGLSLRATVPVSNLCTLTVALVGTAMFIFTGQQSTTEISYATGYIYWPAVLGISIPSMLMAPWGARISYILPMQQLRYAFISILFLTAVSLFLGV